MDTTKNRHANSATRSGASGTQRKASGGPRGIPQEKDVRYMAERRAREGTTALESVPRPD